VSSFKHNEEMINNVDVVLL